MPRMRPSPTQSSHTAYTCAPVLLHVSPTPDACLPQSAIDDAAALALEALHEPVVTAMRSAGAKANMALAGARLAVADVPLHSAVCQG